MARHMRRLKQRAASVGAAQNRPVKRELHRQIRGANREYRGEVGSLNSEQAALMTGLRSATHSAKNIPGLRGVDRRELLSELSSRRADAGSMAALGIRQARSTRNATVTDLRGQLVDAARQQGLDTQSALSDLISAQQDRRTTLKTNRQDNRNAIKLENMSEVADAVAAAASLKKGGGSSALTPYQQKEQATKRHNALALVRAAYEKSAAGGTTPDGKPVPPVPATPQAWRSWGDQLYSAYHTQVSRPDIEWAIKRLHTSFARGAAGIAASALGS